jgi:hypothetical protein
MGSKWEFKYICKNDKTTMKMPSKYRNAWLKTGLTGFFMFSLFGLLACKSDKANEPILAQVGTSTLTLADLRESFPVEFEQLIRRDQYLDFIKRWIDDEVIYQQAKKAGLDHDSLVAHKLAKVQRKLLIEEFLSRDTASEVFEPDEMAMSQYYEMHKDEFRRKAAEYKFAQIRVATTKQAMDLRGKINRGDFLALAATNSQDATPEAYTSIRFKQPKEFLPCLSKEIVALSINAVTMPITCSDGVYLIKLLDKHEAGELIPFPESKEEISGLLIMDRKDKLTEERIARYKDGLAINYILDNVPGQADNQKTAAPGQPTEPADTISSGTAPAVGPIASVKKMIDSTITSKEVKTLPQRRRESAPRKRASRTNSNSRTDTTAISQPTLETVPDAVAPAAVSKPAEENSHDQTLPENP